MIFDDHDMIDDWNISRVVGARHPPASRGGSEHVVGGLVSYWIYQHLGNLSPAEIRAEGMLDAMLGELDDGGRYLRDWAEQSEEFTPGARWLPVQLRPRSRTTCALVVIDCRNGRVLEPGERADASTTTSGRGSSEQLPRRRRPPR